MPNEERRKEGNYVDVNEAETLWRFHGSATLQKCFKPYVMLGNLCIMYGCVLSLLVFYYRHTTQCFSAMSRRLALS